MVRAMSAGSPLRPSGKMQFGELMVDVVTEGDFVETGRDVKVIGKQGKTITAMRTILNATRAQKQKRQVLEVIE